MKTLDWDRAVELYVTERVNLQQVSQQTNIGYNRLRFEFIKRDIKIRGNRGNPVGFQVSKGRLEELYLKQRLSTTDIGKLLGCHQTTILRKLHGFDIPMRTISEGELNALSQGKSWGGAREKMPEVKHIEGYLMRHLPTHPSADHQGYVMLHVLVWMEANGEIPRDSVIHHINGDITDNRFENLHLFTNSEHSKFHAFARREAARDGHTADGRLACPVHLLGEYFAEYLKKP